MNHQYWTTVVALLKDRLAKARSHSDKGNVTLEQIVWAALIFGAATAAIAIIIAAIERFSSQIQ
ncbi:hypothetical protein OHA25_08175 [Nonomuraea sp. NBC_00507]|uniref:hypothetical protein n=1 Tax=Nonomuraea sp. NBC_00507 TaxID=2976002 RepID=UPI002E185A65